MLYFDTSIIAPMLLNESATARVEKWMGELPAGELAISQWMILETLSLIGREARTGRLVADSVAEAESDLEKMVAESFEVVLPTVQDFEIAKTYLRRYEIGLRGGDALHLAIAANRGAVKIFSLDRGMVKAGKMLGLPVETGID
jgi:predicted nucleic acid-binding protein